MFRFWRGGEQKAAEEVALSVVLIGEGYRRAYAKHLLERVGNPLAGHVEVVGELASDRRVELLAGLEPEVVILDCASEGINPLAILSRLASLKTLKGSPRVVALMDGSMELGEEALLDLGADTVADIRDPHALAEAVRPRERMQDPLGELLPKSVRREESLAAAA